MEPPFLAITPPGTTLAIGATLATGATLAIGTARGAMTETTPIAFFLVVFFTVVNLLLVCSFR